jgi:KDO2-lipid IV(A) lauroyltransferase
MTLKCIEIALGAQFSPEDRIRLVHDHFRHWACSEMDVVRLAGNGQRLVKLVEIRGLEHIEQALAEGKGGVIGSAHFGSWEAGIGVLGALGFPVRVIAYQWPEKQLPRGQKLVRPNRLIGTLFDHILDRHLRPTILFDEGSRSAVASGAGRALERNELVFVMMDVVGAPSRHPNAVPVPFLGGLAYLPTGAIRIAKSAGAPLLVSLIHRSRDWRHQVVEISAPIPTGGDTSEINRRCAKLIEDAIYDEPASWGGWDYKNMAKIGLISEEELRRLVTAGGSPLWY